MALNFKAFELDNAGEALQHVDASGRSVAITLRSRPAVIDQSDADRR